MSSDFSHIRSEMPLNLRGRASSFTPSGGAAAEIARVFDIWEASLATSDGRFLFGDFTIADCMYAPVMSRFRTYGIPLTGVVGKWAEALWSHPSVLKWIKLASA
jgi:glutathione S-transferase